MNTNKSTFAIILILYIVFLCVIYCVGREDGWIAEQKKSKDEIVRRLDRIERILETRP